MTQKLKFMPILLYFNAAVMAQATNNSLSTQVLQHVEETAAGNPFIRHIYTADPSAHVWADGRLYVYPSHDVVPLGAAT